MPQLFCQVWGDSDAVPFPVKIDGGDTVGNLKELIRTKNPNDFEHIDPVHLKLWKWNQPGGVEGLDLGSSNVLNPMDTMEEIFENDPPKRKCVHIVIKVPAHETRRHLDIEWSGWKEYHGIEYSVSASFIDINSTHRSLFPTTPEKVYCRKDFHDQMAFLCNPSGNAERWVLGPPGTGKSLATEVYASHMTSRNSVVTWIGLRELHSTRLIQLSGTQFRESSLSSRDHYRLGPVLEITGKHTIIIDGMRSPKANQAHADLLETCRDILYRKKTRELIIASSMQTIGEKIAHCATQYDFHMVHSWGLDDYYRAMEDSGLFRAVAEKLDASLNTELLDKVKSGIEEIPIKDRKELIEAKYYYAGGFCRGMFNYSTSALIRFLRVAVKSVADPETYFTALVGPHAPDTKNILLAEVDDSSVAGTLISDYVGYLLSMKINVHVLQEFFFNTPGLNENRSVEGWFFEAKFFSLVSRSQDQSIMLFTPDGESIQWVGGHIIDFDPNEPNLREGVDRWWLKPIKFNQGGYDSILVDKGEGVIRFIQLTIQTTHTFKFEYYNQAVRSICGRLGESGLTVEVYFIVPRTLMRGFKIPADGHLEGCKGGADKATRSNEGREECVCWKWRHVAGMEWGN